MIKSGIDVTFKIMSPRGGYTEWEEEGERRRGEEKWSEVVEGKEERKGLMEEMVIRKS